MIVGISFFDQMFRSRSSNRSASVVRFKTDRVPTWQPRRRVGLRGTVWKLDKKGDQDMGKETCKNDYLGSFGEIPFSGEMMARADEAAESYEEPRSGGPISIAERQEIAEEIFAECIETLRRKGADYSGDEDSLKNFKRAAENLGLTSFQVWAVYYSKHVDSILNSIKRNPKRPQVESESLRGRIVDVINYSLILQALLIDLERSE